MIGRDNNWPKERHDFQGGADIPNADEIGEHILPCSPAVSLPNTGDYGALPPTQVWFNPLQLGDQVCDFHPVSRNQEWKTHVGDDLGSRFGNSSELKTVIKTVLTNLESYLDQHHPNANYQAAVEEDFENPDRERYTIRVEIEVDSVEQWKEAQNSVREIAREAEQDDIWIYTIVEKMR